MILQSFDDNLTSVQQFIVLFLLLSLNFSSGNRKGTNEGLRKSSEHVIVDFAGELGAVKFLDGQLDGEGDQGVDIGVGARGVGVGFHIGHSLSLQGRKKRLDAELDEGLLDGHKAEGLEVSESKDIDVDQEFLRLDLCGQVHVLGRSLKVVVICLDNKGGKHLAASGVVLIVETDFNVMPFGQRNLVGSAFSDTTCLVKVSGSVRELDGAAAEEIITLEHAISIPKVEHNRRSNMEVPL